MIKKTAIFVIIFLLLVSSALGVLITTQSKFRTSQITNNSSTTEATTFMPQWIKDSGLVLNSNKSRKISLSLNYDTELFIKEELINLKSLIREKPNFEDQRKDVISKLVEKIVMSHPEYKIIKVKTKIHYIYFLTDKYINFRILAIRFVGEFDYSEFSIVI
jgi:hypothetical protein